MCTSTCPTQDHQTWGECVRAKGLRVGWASSASGRDLSNHKKSERSLDAYEAARRQGIQPDSTNPRDVQRAVVISDKTGSPYQAI